MFAWELWREVMESSMEMAAKTALSNLSVEQGAQVEADAYGPSSHRNDLVFAEYELFRKLGNMSACFIDEEAHAQEFSTNWQEVIGLSPYQCYQENFDHFFHPQHRHLLGEKLEALQNMCQANQTYRETISFKAQYGSTHHGYHWYEFLITPYRMAGDKKKLFAVLLRRITREIELERSLDALQAKVDVAMKSRAEFLSHMSHELRTPLNAMLGFSEMMERGVFGTIEHEVYSEYLSNIRESGNTLLNRINDMLEISSIELGEHSLDESRVEPESLFEAAKKKHRHEAFCRKVNVRIPKNFPRVLVHCDEEKMARAIGSVLSNAVRYSAAGQTVDMQCALLADGTLHITVEDEGEGISPEHLTTLRESLEKPNCLFSCNPEAVGLGLGLTVAKEFTRMHGIDLHIESTKNQGTNVTFTIPAERITQLEIPRRTKARTRAYAV